IFACELGDAPRVPGGLREQGQKLREQVAGAMPHVADHQLMTLLELPALDRASEHIGHRGEERYFMLAENPLMQRAHPKDAVSAAVATGDRDAKAAHAFMVFQIARDLKPLFLEIVVSHHRYSGIECKTGIA